VWDVADRSRVASIQAGYGITVATPSLSADGTTAVVPGTQTVKLYDVGGDQPSDRPWHAKVLGINSAAVAPDGRVLVSSDGGTATVLDPAGKPPIGFTSSAPVTGAEFALDGRVVVTSGRGEHAVALWDATTGAQLLSLPGQVAIPSPDGRHLLVPGAPASLYACEPCGDDIDELLDLAAERTTRDLTAAERVAFGLDD
jgi:WD40 repeat protein